MMKMKAMSAATLLVLAAAVGSSAHASNCEQVKADIAAKIDANGVPVYSLTVVDAGTAHTGKEVGHCGGNTKRIIYVRGVGEPVPSPSPAAAPAVEEADPVAPIADAPAEVPAETPASP